MMRLVQARISVAEDLNLCEAGADFFQVAFGELNVERSMFSSKVANTLRAWDGYEVIALSKNPGEGQLGRGRAFLAG